MCTLKCCATCRLWWVILVCIVVQHVVQHVVQEVYNKSNKLSWAIAGGFHRLIAIADCDCCCYVQSFDYFETENEEFLRQQSQADPRVSM